MSCVQAATVGTRGWTMEVKVVSQSPKNRNSPRGNKL